MPTDLNKTLEEAAKELGSKIFTAAKEAAGDGWEDIEQANKDQIQVLAVLLGQLKLREVLGEDVNDLVKHVESQVTDLEFTNKSIGARSIQAFWEKALEISGSIIFGVAKRLIGL